MSVAQVSFQRKAKANKGQTLGARRSLDRARRAARRPRTVQRQRLQQQFRFRVKVVRYYRALRAQMREKEAVARTLARYQPREDWHQPLCVSSIRQWHRRVGKHDWSVLRPQPTRPHTIHYQVPELLVGIIFTLRKLYGWGGHRIAAELHAREIGQVCGRTVYAIFERLGLEVKTYALKGRSEGIAYHRYEKKRPNAQWHIDFKETSLQDGTKVWIAVLIDDYSRYALAAVATRSANSECAAEVVCAAIARVGCPKEIVSDNGNAFAARWENAVTRFGQILAEQGITHRLCAPYYPQGNGKAEAFIQTLTREVLTGRSFASLDELQAALERYLTYYNNYRLHSALGYQPPVTRFTGRAVIVRGLAGLPGLEPMAADPKWGVSYCDPPIPITPFSVQRAYALAVAAPVS